MSVSVLFFFFFCNSDSDPIIHLFFHCAHSNVLWLGMQNVINKKMGTDVQVDVFDVMLYFVFITFLV